MEVVAAYHDKIKKFEKQVLLKRKMATVTNRTSPLTLSPSLLFLSSLTAFPTFTLLSTPFNSATNTPHPAVHILSSDLVMHKRTLAPLKTLIYGLRRYDLDRCAALVDPEAPGEGTMWTANMPVGMSVPLGATMNGAAGVGMNGGAINEGGGGGPASAYPHSVRKEPVVGYMSHKSKIYLADVHDHAEYIITSLDM